MSSYLVEPKTISTVSVNTGIDARAIGTLNLKATGYRYRSTPAAVAKEFLGISMKEYLGLCEEFEPYQEPDLVSFIEEILYQCSEGDYDLDPIYLQLQQAKEGLG